MKAASKNLWGNRDFMTLWAGETVSHFGAQVTLLALPLTAALILGADARQMGVLGAFEYFPYLLVGLFAGVWVDRRRRLPILITANFLRASLLALIPVSVWLGHLNFELLYFVAFFAGVCMVFFDIAYQSYLPSLVESHQLIEGNSKLETSRSAAQIAGPGLAGVLAQTVTAPFSIFVTSATFFLSALFMTRIGRREALSSEPQTKQTKLWRSLGDGFRFVRNEPNVFALTRCAMIWNLSWNTVFAVFVLHAARDLHLDSSEIGIIYGASGIGLLLGAIIANQIMARLGVGPTLVLTGFVAAAGGPFFPMFAQSHPLAFYCLFTGQFILGFGSCIFGIAFASVTQSIVPATYLGRVMGVSRFITAGALSIGSLIGGYLGHAVVLRATLIIGSIGMFIAVSTLLFSPLLKTRQISTAISYGGDSE
jgi:MFS family permease